MSSVHQPQGTPPGVTSGLLMLALAGVLVVAAGAVVLDSGGSDRPSAVTGRASGVVRLDAAAVEQSGPAGQAAQAAPGMPAASVPPVAAATEGTAAADATVSDAASLTVVSPAAPAGPAVGTAASSAATPAWMSAAVTWTGVSAPAQTLRDVRYGTASGLQALDLHLPARTGRPVPVVVLVHGGGFSGGDKGDWDYAVPTLVGRGFAVANVNYRLAPADRFPAGAQDVKSAVRWLRAHAATYGLDGNRFGGWGDSAGGYLVAMLGATGDQRTVFDPATGDTSVPPASWSSAVQAVVDWYGPTDFLTMDTQNAATQCRGGALGHNAADSPESVWLGRQITQVPALAAQASVLTYVATAAALPPFRIVHGSADCLVPSGQSSALAAAVSGRGGSASLTILPGADHGGDAFGSRLGTEVSFLATQLGL